MSQRRFRCGPFQIQTGWDRPQQHYHLTIIRDAVAGGVGPAAEAERAAADDGDDDDEDDGIVYTQLATPRGGLTLDEVFAVLGKFKITPPETLLPDLRGDVRGDTGSDHVHYPDTAFAGDAAEA